MTRDEELESVKCDFKTVSKTDAGIAVLAELARFCGEGQNPYVAGSFDHTAQKCGKLAVILYIRKMLASDGEPRQTQAITEPERNQT